MDYRNTGMDYWNTGMNYWTTGMDYWNTGMDYWNIGMDYWNGYLSLVRLFSVLGAVFTEIRKTPHHELYFNSLRAR